MNWDRAGAAMKIPVAGVLVALDAPVSTTLGDLLLALIADTALGRRGFAEGSEF